MSNIPGRESSSNLLQKLTKLDKLSYWYTATDREENGEFCITALLLGLLAHWPNLHKVLAAENQLFDNVGHMLALPP